MTESLEYKLLRSISNRPLEMVATIGLLLVFWGGLVPFDFQLTPDQPVFSRATWAHDLGEAHISDMVANVAMFIPLGMFIRLMLRRRDWSAFGSFVGTLILLGGISAIIETAQAFSPRRDSSAVDWVCNVGGAAFGAMLYQLLAFTARSAVDAGMGTMAAWGERWRARPVALIARCWAVCIALAALTPFDVTFSVDRLVASVRDTTVIPFARATRLGGGLGRALAGVTGEKDLANNLWQLRLDYLWTLFAYAIMAVLTCRYLSKHCRVIGLRRTWMAVTSCVMLAFALSGVQIFIMSRSADVTYVILAAVGALAGCLMADNVVRAWSPSETGGGPFAPAKRVRLVNMAVLAGFAYIAARQLAPFDFDLRASSIIRQINHTEWIPMVAYQHAHLPLALDDLLHKMMRWSWLVAMLCIGRRHRGTSDQRQPVAKTVLLAVGAVAVLEAAQVLLPARNPSLTDLAVVAIATGGAVVAYRLAATALAMNGVIRPVEVERVLFNVELGLPSEGTREPDVSVPTRTTDAP